MKEDKFSVFAGVPDHLELAVWMQEVAGFDCAEHKMRELAASCPGDYFIVDMRTDQVAGEIHNGPTQAEKRSHPGKMDAA